ncbi:MAG: FAD-dependent oxidoreductase [Bacillota bacterium]|nr:FAD-dependent oxidoreductase [Bacillota bacterium]
MTRSDVTIIGAGPAGLAAAIEAARAGAKVVLVDENARPGGQLFKQIHKFFGSREHFAGTRGIDLARKLCQEAQELGVQLVLDTAAFAIYDGRIVAGTTPKGTVQIESERIILATGAMENTFSFKGWTKPGVMGAGAAQTMINLHRVLPGSRILMVGSGNVGLIVTYQLLQAGADVVAVIEALPKIGGYAVHAAKVRRAGVPILTSHTVLEAKGEPEVSSAVICQLDDFKPVAGTEREVEVDTVCLAVGLTPLAELAWMAGCQCEYLPALGGFVPVHDERMETTVKGIFVAGDVTGVEEASTAIEEGRLAGIAAAASLGLLSPDEAEERMTAAWERLAALRMGPFGEGRQAAKEQLMKVGKAG